MCRGQGPVLSHKTGWTNTRHDVPSETNHDMKYAMNWFFFFFLCSSKCMSCHRGDPRCCVSVPCKSQEESNANKPSAAKKAFEHSLCCRSSASLLQRRGSHSFLGFLHLDQKETRRLWSHKQLQHWVKKCRQLEVFKMTELDARVEIEEIQRPWRALINPRGITTGLILHVICNFHRPVVDSLSDTCDWSPMWSTSSLLRAVLLGSLKQK